MKGCPRKRSEEAKAQVGLQCHTTTMMAATTTTGGRGEVQELTNANHPIIWAPKYM
jgi:hypothetical protein